MKHLFVPYTISVKLKENGFNEPCIAQYLTDKSVKEGKLYPTEITCSVNEDFDEDGYKNFDVVTNYDFRDVEQYVTAPLYQQVVDWLYGKGISLELYSCDMGKNFNHVLRKVGRNLYEIKALDNKAVPDRYQAFNKGIEEALKLLNQTK